MKVLSLFDGISCGRIALERAGISVSRYVAFEIDKHAIKCSQSNYPDIEHLGSVEDADFTKFKGFDMVIGGFPCTDLSMAGKREGLKGKHSRLFWDLVRAIKEVQPKYFLVENNYGMPKKDEAIITETLGVSPIHINSALVSAQNRDRLYWTNIPNIEQPKDRKILLEDILEDKTFINGVAIKGRNIGIGTIVGRRINGRGVREDTNKKVPIIQCLEVRKNKVKSNCLTTVQKDNVVSNLPPGRYIDAYGKYKDHFRYLTVKEYERLQTLPEGYTSMISDNQTFKVCGMGWTVDVIAHIFSYIKSTEDRPIRKVKYRIHNRQLELTFDNGK